MSKRSENTGGEKRRYKQLQPNFDVEKHFSLCTDGKRKKAEGGVV